MVSSQDQVHGPYGGVVPELASRQHIKNVLPIVDGALRKAGVKLMDLRKGEKLQAIAPVVSQAAEEEAQTAEPEEPAAPAKPDKGPKRKKS